MKNIFIALFVIIFSISLFAKNKRSIDSELFNNESEIRNFIFSKIQDVIAKNSYEEKTTELVLLIEFVESQYNKLENELIEIDRTTDPEIKKKILDDPLSQQKRTAQFETWVDYYLAFQIPKQIIKKDKNTCSDREKIFKNRYGTVSRRDSLRKQITVMVDDICLSYTEKKANEMKENE